MIKGLRDLTPEIKSNRKKGIVQLYTKYVSDRFGEMK